MEPRRYPTDRSASSGSAEKGPRPLDWQRDGVPSARSVDRKDHGFSKRYRVKDAARFSAAYQSTHVAVDQRLIVSLLRNESTGPKLGISIPKKTGHAPLRNRWKRLIREAFRLQRDQLPEGWDIFVRPRKGAQPIYSQIAVSLIRLAHRASHAANSGRK